MAVKIATAADIAKKWVDVTPGRSSYYEAGALAAGTDWVNGATAAASAYKSAVTAGNIGQMFAGGVKKAGADKYTRKVKDVGVGRFSSGVQAASTDMQSGMEPMVQTIASLTLTGRGPRGSTGNLIRVSEVATALNKKRLALRAAGA